MLRIWLDSGRNLGSGELLNLLGRTADKGRGIEESVQLGEDGVEEGGAADAVEQVVVLAVLLDIVGGLVGKDACGGKQWVLGQSVEGRLFWGWLTYGSPRGRPGGRGPSSRRP